MSGLSRRAFLATTGALAASFAVPADLLGKALAAPFTPSEATTTLQQTIRQLSTGYKQYRTLVTQPGEEYVARMDLLSGLASEDRAKHRRSIAYIGHLSDIHMIDAQSPARWEPMFGFSPTTFAGTFRPQDPLSVQVLAAMVAAMAAVRYSPLTGAPMAAAINTGDNADMHNSLELRWYIDVLDGKTVINNSGIAGQYEGVQVWEEATYAYHPEDPSNDQFGEYGFPTLPGMLTAAVSTPVPSVGLPVPWYTTYGNHDALFFGAFPMEWSMKQYAVGDRKAATWEPLVSNYITGLAVTASPLQRMIDSVRTSLGQQAGMRTVTADPDRKLFDQIEFMQMHMDTPSNPGPIGHGYTQANIDSGQTWYATDITPNLRAFSLNTCNSVAGADGAVPEDQFNWLEDQLATAQQQNILCIVFSHHNTRTLENNAHPAIGPSQTLYHAPEFIAMLQKYPVLIAWINGHTHTNTITAHPKEGGGGFWEITTASCIDFPQQQSMIEVIDNRDGTISIFNTVLDHASPAAWSAGDYTVNGLASLSRELSANFWIEHPALLLGSELDRNTELLMPAPFDMSLITDAALAQTHAAQQARIVAYDQARNQ